MPGYFASPFKPFMRFRIKQRFHPINPKNSAYMGQSGLKKKKFQMSDGRWHFADLSSNISAWWTFSIFLLLKSKHIFWNIYLPEFFAGHNMWAMMGEMVCFLRRSDMKMTMMMTNKVKYVKCVCEVYYEIGPLPWESFRFLSEFISLVAIFRSCPAGLCWFVCWAT